MIEGMKVGEHREGPLTMPTGADFQPATLRGQDTTVSVTLNELFVPDLPTVGCPGLMAGWLGGLPMPLHPRQLGLAACLTCLVRGIHRAPAPLPH